MKCLLKFSFGHRNYSFVKIYLQSEKFTTILLCLNFEKKTSQVMIFVSPRNICSQMWKVLSIFDENLQYPN